MFLYKYRPIDKWTLIGLNNKTIHFKCPNSYNDPFDSRINIIAEGSEEDWKQLEKEYSQDEIQKFRRVFQSKESRNLLNWDTHVNTIKVSCFSEVSDDILMWSHYADNHKGICLKFKTQSLPLNGFEAMFFQKKDFAEENLGLEFKSTIFYQVKYSDKMLSPLNYLKFELDQVQNFFLTKSVHWSYEKEWRIVATDNQLKISDPKYLDNQLQAIIFGMYCTQSDIDLVRKVILNQNIELFKANASREEYKLEITPI